MLVNGSDFLAPSPMYVTGATSLNFTATDQAGNAASCLVRVEVFDRTPPTLHCPQTVHEVRAVAQEQTGTVTQFYPQIAVDDDAPLVNARIVFE